MSTPSSRTRTLRSPVSTYLVIHDAVCGPGMEEALRVAAFDKVTHASRVALALNRAYTAVMMNHKLNEFDPEDEDNG